LGNVLQVLSVINVFDLQKASLYVNYTPVKVLECKTKEVNK